MFDFRCDNGAYLRKLPLDLITLVDAKKCFSDLESINPVYSIDIPINIDEELDQFVLFFPGILVNGEEKEIEPITFIKKEFEEGFSGTL